jgi:hypothetical protein
MTVDPDTEAIIAAARRWAEADRQREVEAVRAWSRRHRARQAAASLDAMVASAASRGIWYPAWSRFPPAVTASAGRPPAGVVRCRCGDISPCECTLIDEELAASTDAGNGGREARNSARLRGAG